jgi:2-polyprenyl-3-methyl-5-hydroxy-6-metoxy-1,4-benzoquinol methylase
MDDADILDKINSFSQWNYQFELAGHKTTFDVGVINRHEQRKNYFFQPLVNLLGGSLAGKRVLDLGCNQGFWSLAAIEKGCDYVLGIDGRQMNIDQARFVFDVKGINKDRYNFCSGNIFDLLNDDLGKFDIVLCLGLMYHISKPMTLLERISAVNTDLLVIDTTLSFMRKSILEIRKESLEVPVNAIDYELVFYPSRTALLDIVHQFHYRIVVLRPSFSDYTSATEYKKGTRRAFICAKQTDLTVLDAYAEPLESVQSINLMDIPAKDMIHALAYKVIHRLGINARYKKLSRSSL